MKKFEYLDFKITENQDRIELLNALGQGGWEVISIGKEETEKVHDGMKHPVSGALYEFEENYYDRTFQIYLLKREV